MAEAQGCQLVWGCEPNRQLEQGWLLGLLEPARQLFWPKEAGSHAFPQLDSSMPTVLVESGLLLLQRNPDPAHLQQQAQLRRQRFAHLGANGPFALIHLSDEEGLDADELYPLLPPYTVVWRNFPYPRFQGRPGLHAFPIGPRAEFLSPILQAPAFTPASRRLFPWAFMGTLWASGSRTLAASLFLRSLPNGFFFGGKRFGQGLPLPHYRKQLMQSAFALCPEGDRHLDTFRLYESLQAGCIPVVVDQRSMALPMLGSTPPFPVWSSWQEALVWVQGLLDKPEELDSTQSSVRLWWRTRCIELRTAMRHTLIQSHAGKL
jgi:hypothetical protein